MPQRNSSRRRFWLGLVGLCLLLLGAAVYFGSTNSIIGFLQALHGN